MPIEIKNPAGFPKLLGLTDPGVCPIENTPELTIGSTELGGEVTVWLGSVQSAPFPEPASYCAGAQQVDYGEALVARDGGLLTWPLGAPDENLGLIRDIQVFDVQNAPIHPENRRVELRIGDNEAELIKQAEVEHTEDHRQAFALTVEHLTESINDVANSMFTDTSRGAATAKLLRALAESAGPLFVPEQPYDLWRWRDRVAYLYAEARLATEKRDYPDGNHKVFWFASYENDGILVIYPQIQNGGPEPHELITLDGIAAQSPDWTLPPPPVPRPAHSFSIGQSVLVDVQWAGERVDIFEDESLSGTAWLTLTFGEIEADTYAQSPIIELVVVQLVGEDGYVVRTQLTDPDSTLDPKSRKDCYFHVAEKHYW
jgi:hypothetical protein